MAKYMYFADGNGANLSGEAYTASSDQVMCVVPTTTTTTTVWFKRADMGRDKIVFTHDNTATADPSPGHRCKDIAKAIAEVSNANPHHTMVDMVDLDNTIYYSNLNFITGIAITLQDQA